MGKIKFMMSGVWTFLLPFIKILMSQAGQILAASALNAVSIMANRDMNSDQKRAAAAQLVKVDLANAGLEMATSVVNAAIEAAVVRFKEK